MEKPQHMEVTDYSASVIKRSKTNKWTPFLKQLLICSGVWTYMFTNGLYHSVFTVLTPPQSITGEGNNTEVISNSMVSWLTSVYSFSGFPYVIILSIVTRFVGRRIPFIIAVLNTLAAFTVLYFSTNVTQILISNIMMEFFSASQIIITSMILTEYSSPTYRGIFLTVKAASFCCGGWASKLIAIINWKYIPLFGMVCSIYTSLTFVVWPESPYWLASRGRFKECAASHRSLKGCGEESEKELEALINSQREYIARCGNIKLSAKQRLVNFFKTIKSEEFYKPTTISIMAIYLGAFSGRFDINIYTTNILKKITNSESTAYVDMLVLDGIAVLSMYGGCALSKYLKRRTQLLVASSVAVLFLFVLSMYLYLITLNVFAENISVSEFILIACSIAVSCGPVIMSTSVYGELISIRSRNLSICFIALTSKLELCLYLKLAPLVFTFGTHGTFLTLGICSLIIILALNKYLPETKDKTLQEIADSMKGVNSERAAVKLLVHNKV